MTNTSAIYGKNLRQKLKWNNILIISRQILQKIATGIISAVLILTILTLPDAAAQAQTNMKTTFDTKAPVNVSKDVNISADELEANLRKDIVIFVGNVVITQEELALNSDRVTVFYQNAGNKKSSISRIDASGTVKLTTKTETINATWGIYDFTDKIITLGGKVILKRDDGEINGTRLVYNLDTGLITIEGSPKNNGRVEGQFTLPDKSSKPDKSD